MGNIRVWGEIRVVVTFRIRIIDSIRIMVTGKIWVFVRVQVWRELCFRFKMRCSLQLGRGQRKACIFC